MNKTRIRILAMVLASCLVTDASIPPRAADSRLTLRFTEALSLPLQSACSYLLHDSQVGSVDRAAGGLQIERHSYGEAVLVVPATELWGLPALAQILDGAERLVFPEEMGPGKIVVRFTASLLAGVGFARLHGKTQTWDQLLIRSLAATTINFFALSNGPLLAYPAAYAVHGMYNSIVPPRLRLSLQRSPDRKLVEDYLYRNLAWLTHVPRSNIEAAFKKDPLHYDEFIVYLYDTLGPHREFDWKLDSFQEFVHDLPMGQEKLWKILDSLLRRAHSRSSMTLLWKTEGTVKTGNASNSVAQQAEAMLEQGRAAWKEGNLTKAKAIFDRIIYTHEFESLAPQIHDQALGFSKAIRDIQTRRLHKLRETVNLAFDGFDRRAALVPGSSPSGRDILELHMERLIHISAMQRSHIFPLYAAYIERHRSELEESLGLTSLAAWDFLNAAGESRTSASVERQFAVQFIQAFRSKAFKEEVDALASKWVPKISDLAFGPEICGAFSPAVVRFLKSLNLKKEDQKPFIQEIQLELYMKLIERAQVGLRRESLKSEALRRFEGDPRLEETGLTLDLITADLKAVFFDLDQTLVESSLAEQELHREALLRVMIQIAMDHPGRLPLTLTQMEPFFDGMDIPGIVKALGISPLNPGQIERYRSHYLDVHEDLSKSKGPIAVKGSKATIQALKDRGIPIAVGTKNRRLKEILRSIGVGELIEQVSQYRLRSAAKTPALLSETKRLKLRKSSHGNLLAMLFTDGPKDAEEGRALGWRVTGIVGPLLTFYSMRADERLQRLLENAHYVVFDLENPKVYRRKLKTSA